MSGWGIGRARLDAAASAATNRPEHTTQTTARMHNVNITLKSGAYSVPLANAGQSVRDRDSFGFVRLRIEQMQH